MPFAAMPSAEALASPSSGETPHSSPAPAEQQLPRSPSPIEARSGTSSEAPSSPSGCHSSDYDGESAPLPELPLEILDMIIEQAALHQPKPYAAGHCLVSRALLDAARRGLYHSHMLFYYRSDEDSGDEWTEAEHGNLPPDSITTNDAVFRRTLRTSPHLGAPLRELRLDLRFDPFNSDDNRDMEEWLPEMFSSCPNIRKLEVICNGDSAPAATVARIIAEGGWCQRLEELVIDYVPGVTRLLSQFPALKKLTFEFEGHGDDFGDETFPSSFPFSLTHFTTEVPCPEFFKPLLVSSTFSLVDLVTGATNLASAEVGHLAPSLAALSQLYLSLSSVNSRNIQGITAFIGALPNLQRFTPIGSYATEPQPFGPALLAHLRPSLRVLDLARMQVHSSSIFRLLDERKASHGAVLPHLEKLCLSYVVGNAVSRTGKEAERWLELDARCTADGVMMLFGRMQD